MLYTTQVLKENANFWIYNFWRRPPQIGSIRNHYVHSSPEWMPFMCSLSNVLLTCAPPHSRILVFKLLPNEVIGLKSAFIPSYYILNTSQFYACLLSSITIFRSSFSSYFHFSLPPIWSLLLFLLLGKTSLEKWIAK